MRTRDIRKRVKGGSPHLARTCTRVHSLRNNPEGWAVHRWRTGELLGLPAQVGTGSAGKTGNEEEERRCPRGEAAAQRCRAFPWDRRWAGRRLMGQNQRRNQWGWHHRGRMPPHLIRVRANTKASLDSSSLRITDRPCSLGHFHLLSSAGRATRQDTSIGEDF